MSILLGLIPALAWGLVPISATKLGGKTSNQILGTAFGTLIVALLMMFHLQPDVSQRVFILSALSGALWVVGQTGQYFALKRIGVSRTMPISTGLQLVGTSLIGVLIFHEWPSTNARIIGFVALAVVIVGISLTSITRKPGASSGLDKFALTVLFFTNFGYLAYSSIPAVVGTNGSAIFLPQAIGMAVGALLYVLFSRQTVAFRQSATWKNLLTGVLFSIGCLTYIHSAQANGIATGFVLSQLSVVVATLGGIFFLGERKTGFGLAATSIGLVLIVLGGATTAFL